MVRFGIGEDQLEAIFQPFEQVGEAQRRLGGGTGLGLPLSRQFVRLMESNIQVRSQVGQGSTFWFELEVQVVATKMTATSAEGVANGYEGPRRKILVADDVAANRMVLIDPLERLGFETVEAANGSEALEQSQTRRPE